MISLIAYVIFCHRAPRSQASQTGDNDNIALISHQTPATGCLPFLLSFLATARSVVGDELISMLTTWMLTSAVFSLILIIKKLDPSSSEASRTGR